jgi:hypothetical protein
MVDFQSIKNVGKNPKGLYVTWAVRLMREIHGIDMEKPSLLNSLTGYHL